MNKQNWLGLTVLTNYFQNQWVLVNTPLLPLCGQTRSYIAHHNFPQWWFQSDSNCIFSLVKFLKLPALDPGSPFVVFIPESDEGTLYRKTAQNISWENRWLSRSAFASTNPYWGSAPNAVIPGREAKQPRAGGILNNEPGNNWLFTWGYGHLWFSLDDHVFSWVSQIVYDLFLCVCECLCDMMWYAILWFAG